VEFVEAQLLEMRQKRGAEEKKLSVKGARQKEKLYSRTWETFAYTIVTAILEDLVNAIVGPKAAPSQRVHFNEQKQERSLASRRLCTESKLLLRQRGRGKTKTMMQTESRCQTIHYRIYVIWSN